MSKKLLKVAAVQHKGFLQKKEAWEESVRLIREAVQQGAELILLQELHASRYFCQTEDEVMFDLAESIPGSTSQFLSDIAKKNNIVIVSSLFEKRAIGLYHNTAVVLERDGSIAGKYRKMHIPDDPQFYEKYYFAPGDLGFKPIATSVGKLGVLICWDQWFPEAARMMALNGADILLYPTAIGWFPHNTKEERRDLVDNWITAQRAHAISNGIPVVVSNRVGFESYSRKLCTAIN